MWTLRKTFVAIAYWVGFEVLLGCFQNLAQDVMWIDIIFLWIVIATYNESAQQHPIVWPSGSFAPHPLFLCPNLNGRRIKTYDLLCL